MITNQCEVYIIDKGFTKLEDVYPGMKVYTLDGLKVEVESVKSVRSEFINQKINVIDSGQHNVDSTNKTLHLYHSEINGIKYLLFNEIPSHIRSKSTDPKKFNPILAWPNFTGTRNCTDVELEWVARMIAVRDYNYSEIIQVTQKCTGDDALVLIDMLEFWCSVSPGSGAFGRVSVKSRSHVIEDKRLLDEFCRIAAMAGFTSQITNFTPFVYGWKVYYEAMPVAGSRPVNEKFKTRNFIGNVYQVESMNNRAILGRSRNRVFYLPTSQVV